MKILLKIKERIKTYIAQWNRKYVIMPKKAKNIINKEITIIASNCNGGMVYHDLNLKFNSPTVNLFMCAEDYLKFVSNLQMYLNAKLVEKKPQETSYPVGILGEDVQLHFMHYHSFDEAKEKWEARKKRIIFDNLFFMMTDRDGCTQEIIKKFDKLPYKNKVCFTAKPYPQYKCVVYCEEFSKQETVGIMSDFRNIKGERLYDKYFDFVKWING